MGKRLHYFPAPDRSGQKSWSSWYLPVIPRRHSHSALIWLASQKEVSSLSTLLSIPVWRDSFKRKKDPPPSSRSLRNHPITLNNAHTLHEAVVKDDVFIFLNPIKSSLFHAV